MRPDCLLKITQGQFVSDGQLEVNNSSATTLSTLIHPDITDLSPQNISI